jgi:hypothetical protein
MKFGDITDMPGKKRQFANFGEYLYWSYANLQMLHYAVSAEKRKYDRTCYMIRSKAFKAYKEGRWNIHDLLEFNVAKIQQNNYCWYCGKEMESSKLTKDHVFPRSKGGDNDMDNIIMVCKTCNSSKGNLDLFEWYAEVRKEWPPLNILIHYLKNIFLYAIDHDLMDKHLEELDSMDIPFKWRYIPTEYPLPELFISGD